MSAEKKTARPKSVYRHEWKHEISRTDLIAIRQRLRAVATPETENTVFAVCISTIYTTKRCARRSTA